MKFGIWQHLLVLCIIKSTFAWQSAAPVQKTILSCSESNPFSKNFHDIEKFSSPKIDTKLCRSEWDKYGTCCNQAQLKVRAIRDHNSISNSVGSIAKQSVTLRNALISLQEQLLIVSHIPTTLAPVALLPNLLKAKSILELRSTDFDTLIYPKEGEEESIFLSSNSKCWELMAKERSAALCGVCSGRSASFFVGDKAVVSESFCSNFVKECRVSLLGLAKVVRSLKYIETLSQELASVAIKSNTIDNIDKLQVDPISERIKEESIIELIGSNPGSVSAQTELEICSRFIEISKTPFVELVSKLFKSGSPKWDISLSKELEEIYQKNKGKIDNEIKQWKLKRSNNRYNSNWKTSRILQSKNRYFTGDALIKTYSGLLYGFESEVPTYSTKSTTSTSIITDAEFP